VKKGYGEAMIFCIYWPRISIILVSPLSIGTYSKDWGRTALNDLESASIPKNGGDWLGAVSLRAGELRQADSAACRYSE
jgi:hypothetical protein